MCGENYKIEYRIRVVPPAICQTRNKDNTINAGCRVCPSALVHIAAHGNIESGEISLPPNPERTSKVPRREDYLLKMSACKDSCATVVVLVHKARLQPRVWSVCQELSWVLVLARFWCYFGQLMTRRL